MIVLGLLVLVAVVAVAVVAIARGSDPVTFKVGSLSFETDGTGMFLAGAGALLLTVLGVWLLKKGLARSRHRRQEMRELRDRASRNEEAARREQAAAAQARPATQTPDGADDPADPRRRLRPPRRVGHRRPLRLHSSRALARLFRGQGQGGPARAEPSIVTVSPSGRSRRSVTWTVTSHSVDVCTWPTGRGWRSPPPRRSRRHRHRVAATEQPTARPGRPNRRDGADEPPRAASSTPAQATVARTAIHPTAQTVA